MTDAIRDENRTTVAVGVSYSDGTTVTPIKINASDSGLILDTSNTIGFTPTQVALLDNNREAIMMAVSSSSSTTLHPVLINPATGGILADVT